MSNFQLDYKLPSDVANSSAVAIPIPSGAPTLVPTGARVEYDFNGQLTSSQFSLTVGTNAVNVTNSTGSTWKAGVILRVILDIEDENNPDLIVKDTSGNTIIRLPASTGWYQQGVSTQGSGKEIFNLTRLDTNSGSVARPTNAYVEQATNLGVTMTCDFHNIDALCYGGGSNTRYTANVGLYCIEGQAQFTGTNSQTLGKVVGIYGLGKSTSTNGTLQVSVGVQGTVQNTAAGTTTLGACFYARTPTVSAGTMTTAYGFYAEDINTGSTNYSVYTNAGQVRFQAGTAVPAGGSTACAIQLSSTAGLGLYFGTGAPSLSAGKGSLYLNTTATTTTTRIYINTDGSTTWTTLTTAA